MIGAAETRPAVSPARTPGGTRARTRLPSSRYACEGVNRLLVGNKSDIPAEQRQVQQVEGKAFAEKQTPPISFLETSAKTGTFVDTAFLMMASEIKKKMNDGPSKSGGTKVGEKKSEGGCC